MPANLDDARHLAQAYVDGLQVDDDLLDYFLSISKGNIRRLSINLAHASAQARAEGVEHLNRAWWGHRIVYTGQAPKVARDRRGVGL